jgi:vacuolar-type H+-ATPase subunit H
MAKNRFEEIIEETRAAIDNAINEARKDIEQIKQDFSDARTKVEEARQVTRQRIEEIIEKAVEESKELAEKNREQLQDAKLYVEAARNEYKASGSIDAATKAVVNLYEQRKQ